MNEYIAVVRKYAQFSGRSTRREYWTFFLINVLISIFLSFLAAMNKNASILGSLYSLVLLVPGIAVSVRRLHDTNRSGWWGLISLIPLIGTIILIVFLATDSDAGSNKYGPNPKSAKK